MVAVTGLLVWVLSTRESENWIAYNNCRTVCAATLATDRPRGHMRRSRLLIVQRTYGFTVVACRVKNVPRTQS